jgi:hypothetical protein
VVEVEVYGEVEDVFGYFKFCVFGVFGSEVVFLYKNECCCVVVVVECDVRSF